LTGADNLAVFPGGFFLRTALVLSSASGFVNAAFRFAVILKLSSAAGFE
jgi:hypothetical protein